MDEQPRGDRGVDPEVDRELGRLPNEASLDGQALWDVPPVWERELDRLAQPAFLLAPPPDAQQAILAAVLQAAVEMPRPVLVAAATPQPAVAVASAPDPAERPISLTAYLLLAGVVVAYLAALSWAQGMLGGGWLPTLAAQLLAASDAIIGPLPVSEPLTLTWALFQRAPWIALLPLAWLLWERDRASTSPGSQAA
jgi:hypothetical protein